jgi:4-amino-4-deoxy-L-arabinose transferase-like glycosyltransferase
VTALSEATARRLLAGFILLHLVAWTLLPLLFTHALPVDLVEGVIWGQGWQLGYDQPPFQAWILGGVNALLGYQRWGVYLASQLLVATGFLAVWSLSRRIVTPAGALVSVVLLEGVLFLNLMTPNLYPDLIEVPLWVLAIWAFHRALRRGTLGAWAVLGLALAAAAYGKYISAVLAAVMIGFMLAEPQARRAWRTPGPYLAAALCLLLLAPHLLWALRHGLPTVRHVAAVSRPTVGLLDHAMALLGFVGGELGIVVLSGAMLLALAWRDRPGEPRLALAGAPDGFDRRFVATMALGPFALLLAGAVASGVEFRVHWGFAMWSLLGLCAVLFAVPTASRAGLRRLAASWAAVFVAAGAAYAAINGAAPYARELLATNADRALPARHLLRRLQGEGSFPAPELAAFVTREWQRRTGTPLAYVIGNKWVAGNVAFFSPDHPLVLRDGDPAASPWIDMAALRQRGALLVWDSTRDDDRLTGVLQERFPTMAMQPPLTLPWATGARLPPLRLSWAVLYPEDGPVAQVPSN